MSSVYGPALLKPPSTEDNVDEAVGRKKNPAAEFETDHDRAKRIRRERKAQKVKDEEDSKKMQMSQAISALLSSGKSSSGPVGPAGPPGPPGQQPQFVAFGPSAFGPAAEGEVASVTQTAAADTASPAASGPIGPSRPRLGPAAPTVEPAASAEVDPAGSEVAGDGAAKVRVGHMDHFAAQKRVSWDELKSKLAEVAWKEDGVPGSNSFDSYSAKLEKSRNDKLQQQETETKKMLKAINRGKGLKKEKKDKKPKGAKRTADGAVLANSSGSSSAEDDVLLARYKKS